MVVNLIGISESVKANAAFTIIEVTGLIIIVVIGVFALGGGDADPGRALEFKAASSPLALIIAGTTLAFYAFTSSRRTKPTSTSGPESCSQSGWCSG
jgi:APA family basic amino acid/polyamine antiporter